MERSSSVPRPVAEQLLRRAVRMDEAKRAAERAEEQQRGEPGYTLLQLREAAAGSGVDPRCVDDAAAAMLREKAERSRVAILGYGIGTGVAAAIAATGLLASGHPRMAALFIVLDLLLVATVLFGLDDHLRRGMVYLHGFLDDAAASGDPPRAAR